MNLPDDNNLIDLTEHFATEKGIAALRSIGDTCDGIDTLIILGHCIGQCAVVLADAREKKDLGKCVQIARFYGEAMNAALNVLERTLHPEAT